MIYHDCMNVTSPHPILYTAPPLTSEDEVVLGEIHQMRKDLRHVLRTPRRWEGGLRRAALARAIRGSNSIEGYEVAEDDAAAAIDGEDPISADEKTFWRSRVTVRLSDTSWRWATRTTPRSTLPDSAPCTT